MAEKIELISSPTTVEPLKPENTMTKSISTYDKFMQDHRYVKSSGLPITVTRISRKGEKNKGGCWHIPQNEYDNFLKLYYDEVMDKRTRVEHLTEAQLEDGGPLLIDLDFRYDLQHASRYHTGETIDAIVEATILTIHTLFDVNSDYKLWFLQKPNIHVEEKLVKDGIHIIVGVQTDIKTRIYFRQLFLEKCKAEGVFTSLPLINSLEDVVDLSVISGKSNWQMIGSCKPDRETYELTQVFNISEGHEYEELDMPEQFALSRDNVCLLSARYRGHPNFTLTSEITEPSTTSSSSSGLVPSTASVFPTQPQGQSTLAYRMIRSQEQLDLVVADFLEKTPFYEWREIYYYTMALPVQFYGPGSYNEWLKIGCALKNYHDSMLLVWIAFSARSTSFDWSTGIEELMEKWDNLKQVDSGGVTIRTIIYLCKTFIPDKYRDILFSSAGYLIDTTLDKVNSNKPGSKGYSHYDIAKILYTLKKDQYVHTSDSWYEYNGICWKKVEKGYTLRTFISEELRQCYQRKAMELEHMLHALGESSEENENKIKIMEIRLDKVKDIMCRLGDTSMKDNIMREASDIFKDVDFLEKLDTKQYLLACSNGVFDFQAGVFRRGFPEDYISLNTGIPYIPMERKGLSKNYYTQRGVDLKTKKWSDDWKTYVPVSIKDEYVEMSPMRNLLPDSGGSNRFNKEKDEPILREIHAFFQKIFVDVGLCQFMWTHMASFLLGYSNQKFTMYIGKGSNGKSVFTKMMSDILGDYKVDVPLTMVTEKRQKVGGVSPEIVMLKGARLGIIQESSKGDVLNEGIMKQLTSGIDKLQGRGLFQTKSVTFYPQLKLTICSNEMLEIRSQDGGTWRRIEKVPYQSKFSDNPQANNAYEFKKLSEIEVNELISDRWKSLLLSVLVEIAVKMQNHVLECAIVSEASRSYRESMDHMSRFANECLETFQGVSNISKELLNSEFTTWFTKNIGGKPPAIKEIHQYMDENYGKSSLQGWSHVRFKSSSRKNMSSASDSDSNFDSGSDTELDENM